MIKKIILMGFVGLFGFNSDAMFQSLQRKVSAHSLRVARASAARARHFSAALQESPQTKPELRLNGEQWLHVTVDGAAGALIGAVGAASFAPHPIVAGAIVIASGTIWAKSAYSSVKLLNIQESENSKLSADLRIKNDLLAKKNKELEELKRQIEVANKSSAK